MATGQVFFGQWPVDNAVHPDHLMTKLFPHASDDAASVAVQLHANFMRVFLDKLSRFGFDKPLIHNKAFDHFFEVLRSGLFRKRDVVQFPQRHLGVVEPFGQLSVVGEQDESRAFFFDAVHGRDALFAGLFDQVAHAPSPTWVMLNPKEILGFVDEHVSHGFWADGVALNAH